MSESSLTNVQALRTATLKIDSNTNFFLRNLRNSMFYRTSPVAASDSFSFLACNFIKRETPARMFSVNFANFLRTFFLLAEHLRMIASCVYL